MKRILALFLAATMFMSLTACISFDSNVTTSSTSSTTVDTTATTDPEIAGQFMVGYGKADITPTESVPLKGYGTTERRMSTSIKSFLYQIAIAITDSNGKTMLLIASDSCSVDTATAKLIRFSIESKLKVPADNIIIAALHQHSCPDLQNTKVDSAVRYKEKMFIPGAIRAAEAALNNRAPATVETAAVMTENMNFVRRYLTTTGTYNGTENYSNRYVDQETDADNELRLVKFVRQGQTTLDGDPAKDIILTNYQGHPLMGTGSKDTKVHSDLIGVYRDELEERLKCHAIYISGASGNVEFTSRFKRENKTTDYIDHGKTLADLAINAWVDFEEVDASTVKGTKLTFTATCDHSRDREASKAREAYDSWHETGSTTLLKKYGFINHLEAAAVMNKASLGLFKDFEIFAMSIGDVSFIAAPYEMFDTNGMEIKDGSPFRVTVVASCANGGNGYIPSQLGYDHGCYETFSSHFVPGTGEALRNEYLNMLNQLYN